MRWATEEMPSGLWHQLHDREQPLKKILVRNPGPSWIEYRMILKINPLMSDMELTLPLVISILFPHPEDPTKRKSSER
jgi:hypothetical protein